MPFHVSDFIHIVLDSHIEVSLKEGERIRCTEQTICFYIMCMTRYTPIHQQLDMLWVSPENKRNLQLLVRYIVCNGDYVNTVIIASYVVSVDEVLPAKANEVEGGNIQQASIAC